MKSLNVKNWLFIIVSSTIMFSSNILCREYYIDRAVDNFNSFNSIDINAEVKKIKLGSGYIHLSLDNTRYSIRPIPRKIGAEEALHNIVKVGDTIIKSAYSDTILLKSKNEIQYFYFSKPF